MKLHNIIANEDIFRKMELANKILCQKASPSLGLCENSMSMIFGQNKEELELDTKILPDFLKHVAHAVSIKQILHFSQLCSSGKFRQYDYLEKNRKQYNSSTPPEYNLQNIKIPVYLYSGGSDALVSERDIEHLNEILPNVRKYRSFRNFNHADFNYGKNSRSMVFEEIFKAINTERKKS